MDNYFQLKNEIFKNKGNFKNDETLKEFELAN